MPTMTSLYNDVSTPQGRDCKNTDSSIKVSLQLTPGTWEAIANCCLCPTQEQRNQFPSLSEINKDCPIHGRASSSPAIGKFSIGADR